MRDTSDMMEDALSEVCNALINRSCFRPIGLTLCRSSASAIAGTKGSGVTGEVLVSVGNWEMVFLILWWFYGS